MRIDHFLSQKCPRIARRDQQWDHVEKSGYWNRMKIAIFAAGLTRAWRRWRLTSAPRNNMATWVVWTNRSRRSVIISLDDCRTKTNLKISSSEDEMTLSTLDYPPVSLIIRHSILPTNDCGNPDNYSLCYLRWFHLAAADWSCCVAHDAQRTIRGAGYPAP